MSLFSWLPWNKSKPVKSSTKRPAAGTSRAGAHSSQQLSTVDTYAHEEDVGDDAATKFLSPRVMIEVLIDEILRGATMPKEERSIRLYSLSDVGNELQDAEGERFILLVKLKRARPEMWESFPALGVYLIKEIKSRLGADVGQVYWSLSRSAPLAKKLPPEWASGSRASRTGAAKVASAKVNS